MNTQQTKYAAMVSLTKWQEQVGVTSRSEERRVGKEC